MHSPTRFKNILKIASIGAIALVILGYSAFQARGVALGPSITVNEDLSGTTTEAAVITLSGTILRANAISLNDRPIFVDLEGRFQERLALTMGYNILVIKARGADGKEVSETIELYRIPSSRTTSTAEVLTP
jgi:hypothetical protein